MTVYDSIGKRYNTNRSADPRIVAIIADLLRLPSGSLIADIGAGTGNYANSLANIGYKIEAVEPSEQMRNQATPNHKVRWLSGKAEVIPLANDSVDGVIIVLALHHFSDAKLAAKEISRICPNGPIVVFTMDPRESEPFWFDDYFPEITQHVHTVFPPINEVVELISAVGNWQVTITKFPLPRDLVDRNMCSAWGAPEAYLDPQMRQNTSGFALAAPSVVDRSIKRLSNDIRSGEWDKRYGQLRNQKCFDAGFRFLQFSMKR